MLKKELNCQFNVRVDLMFVAASDYLLSVVARGGVVGAQGVGFMLTANSSTFFWR